MRVVASLTTLPCRLGIIRESVQSIIDDCGFDHVVLNIPYTSRRGVTYEDTEIENLKNSLKYNDDRFIVHRIDKDYGPITKIVGCLLWTSNPDDIIVAFDDDRIVIKPVSDLFKEHITAVDGNGVFSLGGWIRGMGFNKYQFVNSNKHTVQVDVVMGVTCIGFRRDAFNIDDLLAFQSDDPRFESLDDLRISGYLASKGIPCYSIGGSPRLYMKDVVYHGIEKISGTIKFWKDNIDCMDKLSRLKIFGVIPKSSDESGFSMLSFAVYVLVAISSVIFGIIGKYYSFVGLGIVIFLWQIIMLLQERL